MVVAGISSEEGTFLRFHLEAKSAKLRGSMGSSLRRSREQCFCVASAKIIMQSHLLYLSTELAGYFFLLIVILKELLKEVYLKAPLSRTEHQYRYVSSLPENS